MNDNIFRILGIQSREDCVSNALAYAFNQSVDFQCNFLKAICDREPNPFTKCRAFTRVSIGDSGVPDIVLLCESGNQAEFVIIENKIRAEEGVDQTERYAAEESVDALHRRFCPDKERENIRASFIFLTLFPDQTPRSKKFITKSHSDLAGIRKDEIAITNVADKLFSDWLTLVNSFYAKSTIQPGDKICENLQDDDGLDGGYLYFRTFLSHLFLPEHLGLEGFFRDSRQGRRYYGAIFSKERWHPGELTRINGTWSLDPNKVFNIHFEPQFNVLTGIFSIYLHYEINPYETASWVQTHIPTEQFDDYSRRRYRFAELLAETGIKEWIFGGGTNQIAKVQLNFQDFSAKNAKCRIETIFDEMTEAIDHVLDLL